MDDGVSQQEIEKKLSEEPALGKEALDLGPGFGLRFPRAIPAEDVRGHVLLGHPPHHGRARFPDVDVVGFGRGLGHRAGRALEVHAELEVGSMFLKH